MGAEYRARYGTAIFDLRVRRGSPLARELVISGRVLLPGQRAAVERAAHRINGRVRYAFEIDEVAAAATPASSFGIADDDIVDVYDSALPAAKLATQVTASDPAFQILEERGGRLLVRLDDGTLGWIDEERIRTAAHPGDRMRPALLNAAVTAAGDIRDTGEDGLSYLGVPYVVGACTRETIDCSGLIQRIFRTTFGVVLPRNTRCQSQRGRAVPVARAREGDVVFFTGSAGLHVGMFLRTGHVLHASYRRHRIAIDTLRELKQSLQVIGVRRMVEAT